MESPTDNLYITNLPTGISEGMICECFSQYGNVVQCKVLPNPIVGGCGAALVRFASLEEAQSIVMQLNGTTPTGFNLPINIKFAQQKSRGGGGGYSRQDADGSSPYGGGAGTSNWGSSGGSSWGKYGADSGGGDSGGEGGDNLYIRGLPEGIDEPWLKEALTGLAPVVSVRVLPNPSPDGTCAALTRFQSATDAARVIELLNGQCPEWCTQRLMVKYATSKGSAPARGGGGGGGYAQKMASGSSMEGFGEQLAALAGADGGFGGLGDASAVERLLTGGNGMELTAEFLVKMVNEAVVLPGAEGYQNNDATIYIAGLPGDTTDDHVYQLFSPLGAIFSVFVKRGGSGGDAWTIAFVNFVDPLSAQGAIAMYNGMEIPDGSVLKVKIKDAKSGNAGGARDRY